MAEIPTPRSYAQIFGEMLDAFTSRTGITLVKEGNPIYSILESVAQSQVRDTEDTFQLQNALSVDRATGDALIAIGNSEGLTLRGATYASGYVSITDTSFSKVTGTLSIPSNVGSNTITLLSAAAFPSAGSVILEGTTFSYTKSSNTLTLSSPLADYHAAGESVVLSQGGSRNVPLGTIIKTQSGTAFALVGNAVLSNGESTVTGVPVVCQTLGSIGNVAANAITVFATTLTGGPYTVTNPLPFTSGKDTESQEQFRERIKATRQSRTRGTATAIETAVQGATSTSEGRVIQSASLVQTGTQATLYVDDGSGYEARTSGTFTDTLIASASGGEKYIQTTQKPVAKAFIESMNESPFALYDGAMLSVKVGGVTYNHTFQSGTFADITKASAFEIVNSINADTQAPFVATTSNGLSKVVIQAKANTHDSIEVVDITNDANAALNFPLGQFDTMYLFKNGTLLVKDGTVATLTGTDKSTWEDPGSTAVLTIDVDNYASTFTYTFTDSDFAAYTQYSTIADGYTDPNAWVSIINSKVIGVTATTDGNTLTIVSNLGANDRAKIAIDPTCTFVTTLKAFDSTATLTIQGKTSDYTLQRGNGTIILTDALVAGDNLIIGAYYDAPSITGSAILSDPVIATGAYSWFVVDDKTTELVSILPATTYTFAPGSGVVTITSSTFDGLADVQAGDWLILWDSALTGLTANFKNSIFKVAYADGSTYVNVNIDPTPMGLSGSSAVNFNENGIAIVRSVNTPQAMSFGSNPTISSLEENSTLLLGATTFVQNGSLLVRTNNNSGNGAIFHVTSNTVAASAFGFSAGQKNYNESSMIQGAASDSVLSIPEKQLGLYASTSTDPRFIKQMKESVYSLSGSNLIDAVSTDTFNKDIFKAYNDPNLPQYNNTNDIYSTFGGWSLAPDDSLTITVDGDSSKVYTVNTGVTGIIAGSVLSDTGLDNSFDLGDFVVQGVSTATIEVVSGTPNETITVSGTKFAPFYDNAKFRIVYPTGGSTADDKTLLSYMSVEAGQAYVNLKLAALYNVTDVETGSNPPYVFLDSAQTQLETFIKVAHYDVASSQLRLRIDEADLGTDIYNEVNTLVSAGNSLPFYMYSNEAPLSTGGTPLQAGVGYSSYFYTSSGSTPTRSLFLRFSALTGYTGSSTLTTTCITIGGKYNTSLGHATNDLFVVDGVAYKFTTSDSFLWTAVSSFGVMSNTYTPAASQVIRLDSTKNTISSVTVLDSDPFVRLLSYSTDPTPLPISLSSADFGSTPAVFSAQTGSLASGSDPAAITFKTGSASVTDLVLLQPVTSKNYADLLTHLLGGYGVGANVSESGETVEIRRVGANESLPDNASVKISGTATNKSIASLSSETPNDNGFYTYTDSLSGVAVGMPLEIVSGTVGNTFHTGNVTQSGSELTFGTTDVWLPHAIDASSHTVIENYYWSFEKAGQYTRVTTNDPQAWINANITPNSYIHIRDMKLFGPRTAANQITVTGLSTAALYDLASPYPVKIYNSSGVFVQNDTISSVVGNVVTLGTGGLSAGNYFIGSGIVIPTANTGFYRILMHDDLSDTTAGVNPKTFYIDNPNVVEGMYRCGVVFLEGDLVIPGDTITVVGTTNVEYTVSSIADYLGTMSTTKVTVATSFPLPANIVKASRQYGIAPRLTSKVAALAPVYADSTKTFVQIEDGYTGFANEFGGSLIATVGNKLSFPTVATTNRSGYRYNTGIIQEAALITYGNEADPQTYPGYAAVGSQIDFAAPMLQRVLVNVVVRLFGGNNRTTVTQLVQQAIALTVNNTPIGEDIAMSDLVSAANAVNGVQAVTVTSPIATGDIIAVGDGQKPVIVQLSDISVSFVGG